MSAVVRRKGELQGSDVGFLDVFLVLWLGFCVLLVGLHAVEVCKGFRGVSNGLLPFHLSVLRRPFDWVGDHGLGYVHGHSQRNVTPLSDTLPV